MAALSTATSANRAATYTTMYPAAAPLELRPVDTIRAYGAGIFRPRRC
jgi:hypothetical protein